MCCELTHSPHYIAWLLQLYRALGSCTPVVREELVAERLPCPLNLQQAAHYGPANGVKQNWQFRISSAGYAYTFPVTPVQRMPAPGCFSSTDRSLIGPPLEWEETDNEGRSTPIPTVFSNMFSEPQSTATTHKSWGERERERVLYSDLPLWTLRVILNGLSRLTVPGDSTTVTFNCGSGGSCIQWEREGNEWGWAGEGRESWLWLWAVQFGSCPSLQTEIATRYPSFLPAHHWPVGHSMG